MTTTRTFTSSTGQTVTINRNAVPEFGLLVSKGDQSLYVAVTGKLKSCQTEARLMDKANIRNPHAAPFVWEIVPYSE
jgi:hypothetical protein